jgi:hypothetical protein
MTNLKRAVFIAAMTVFARLLSAQSGVSLETEIQNIERTANRQGISAVERHDALVRLAQLRQLSGDIEGAARNWLEAAAAIPGQVDDEALLACAYCLAAMGEWDRASTALEPLLPKLQRACFLDTSIKAVKSGNLSALAALASNPAYSQLKSETYFMLWKMSKGQAAEDWRRKLLAEFPQSPEGRLAAGETAASVKTSPFWLLLAGLDSPVPAGSGTAVSVLPAQAVQTNALQTGGVKLQTGVFSQQANAQAQAASLRQAGFSPSIEARLVNSNEMWAVTVFAGTDQGRTIRELREAGFESFPVR